MQLPSLIVLRFLVTNYTKIGILIYCGKMDHHRILIIDDNPAIHDDFRKVLSARRKTKTATHLFLGYSLEQKNQIPDREFDLNSAMQGQEGLDLAQQALQDGKPFSVAFVDMRMPPGMDGLETITKLWKIDPHIQVVICTAYSDRSLSEIRAALEHSDQFLLLKKPFDSVEINQLALALSEKWRLTREERKAAADKANRLKAAEDSLSKHTLFLELATQIAGTGYCHFAPSTCKFEASDKAAQILATTTNKINNLDDFIALFAEEDRERLRKLFVTAIREPGDKDFITKSYLLLPNGDLRHIQLSFVYEATLAGKNGALFGVVHDVTESVNSTNAIKHASLHDPLTGRPNRLKLMQDFDTAIKISKRIGSTTGLLLIDIDSFKSVNDSFGHPIGDQLLSLVADRLAANVRETDTVARIGGDEFAIVQTGGMAPTDTLVILDRIFRSFRDPFIIEDQEIYASISCGVSLAPLNGLNIEKLYKSADLALYRAKKEGKACYRFFDGELDRQIKNRRLITAHLPSAAKDQKLELHYQPIVSCQSTELVAMEALVRWHHPKLGILPPEKFIEVAEETGEIVSIGNWVLNQACTDASNWPDSVRIAVNISAAQFRKGDLFENVARVLQKTGICPHRLELEITEQVLMGNNRATFDILNSLRELGVRIVLDDFGVGYSSLSCLQKFAFDKLKLDHSFLSLTNSIPEAQVIVSAIAGIGNSLKIETCAEGVETAEQFKSACREGYDFAQGFFFSKPAPLAQLRHVFGGGSLPDKSSRSELQSSP